MIPRPSSGWEPEEIVVPPAGLVRVGRGKPSEVLLGHPTVGDPHAVLMQTVAGLQVRDRSRGRTLVNGRPVREVAPLRDGDRVDFGAVTFHVEGGRLRRATRLAGLAITAERLGVDRGSIRVLQGVRLEIRPGEFVGLLGPSGAGKSTLLKCLAGYLSPAPGSRLRADDLELPAQLASFRPLIGYVPQEDAIFPGLTVRENLDFALRLRNCDLGRGERRALIESVLGQLDVAGLADHSAQRISSGERKRVCAAQELLTRPRALFLDEPTSGLDPAQETRLMGILRRLARQGMTVICATHVLENLELFDRVVVVVRGRVAYDGPPGQLLERFGARRYPELYVNLEAAQPAESPPGPGPTHLPSVAAATAVAPPEPIGLHREVAVQVVRGATLIRRDLALVALLVGQPVAIGALIDLSQMSNMEESALVTFAAVTSVWLGLNNTARELVRDRRSYLRERLLGVTPLGHLTAKVALFAAVGLFQVLLLYGVLRLGAASDANLARKFAPLWEPGLVLALWVTYLGGQLLGLVISALAESQAAAVAFLPLVILPQLLLTGAATSMTQEGRFHSIVHLVRTEGQPERSGAESLVEWLSVPLYTRPCVAVLKKKFEPQGVEASAVLPEGLVRAIDGFHLLVLVAATAAVLLLTFRARERRWMAEV
jgi:ABC-type multidrug transport system ATPase subunit